MKKYYLFLLIILACTPQKPSIKIPKNIAQMPLVAQIRGDNAIKFIKRLHGTSIPVQRGVVAFYGMRKEITLYVFEAESAEKAESLLVEMKSKMEESEGPFLPPREVPQEKFKIYPIYTTYGLGQGHFFFRKERTLFWLASVTSLAYDALKDLEKFILQ